MVRYLLEGKADLEAKTASGATSLLMATERCKFEMVRQLVEAKADVNVKCEPHGFHVLHTAVFYGTVETIQYLIDSKAAVDVKNNYGATPLYTAACNGKVEAVRLLIDAKANVKAANDLGLTPLDIATERGKSEVVKFFISADTANKENAGRKNL